METKIEITDLTEINTLVLAKVPIKQIVAATGLSVEEVEKLSWDS